MTNMPFPSLPKSQMPRMLASHEEWKKAAAWRTSPLPAAATDSAIGPARSKPTSSFHQPRRLSEEPDTGTLVSSTTPYTNPARCTPPSS